MPAVVLPNQKRGGRPPKPRKTANVRVHRDIAEAIRFTCFARRIAMEDYVSPLLEAKAKADANEEHRRLGERFEPKLKGGQDGTR